MEQSIIDQIINADARALATTGPHQVNVVPVSVVKILDNQIYLYNFFMKKTVENILTESYVALTCWKGLVGIQIKGVVTYVDHGELFTAATIEMRARFPERTLYGVLVLEPRHVYDVSADSARAGKVLT